MELINIHTTIEANFHSIMRMVVVSRSMDMRIYLNTTNIGDFAYLSLPFRNLGRRRPV